MPETPRIARTGDALAVTVGEVDIARYVLRDDAPQAESPKPYLHPLRTLSGAPLTGYRPSDHRWHKGLQMTLSHVSDQNFWGGPTFAREDGYQWRDNNGSIRHDRLRSSGEDGEGAATIAEDLTWVASTGEHWLEEVRSHRFHSVDRGRGLWALDFSSALSNVRGQDLHLGSPTTAGRPNAGYTGFFWRGPRSWTGGDAVASNGRTGDGLMGAEADWVAFSAEHDEIDGGATMVYLAGSSSAPVPIRWFVRTTPIPVLSPSPAFGEEVVLTPGQRLSLHHRLVFVDRRCTAEESGALAKEFAL
ncbi:DUF6807 domain-containing protein [Nocardiopsis xinjiangensis]|uniref:DUF6807 domain-containing protein n=1 Tax=Nocardiopsis xinjiangensis TaxID=124285 RepID=UPI0003456E53|nr:PmoA family protein [Nocardiopsis xinjiangensis]